MGKRRIVMERIVDNQKRHVCFAKRKKGLFKKARELCTLTGGSIAIICFTPSGNSHTFCYRDSHGDDDHDHQQLHSIIQQYYNYHHRFTTTTHPQAAHPQSPIAQAKAEEEEVNRGSSYREVLRQLEAHKEKNRVLLHLLFGSGGVGGEEMEMGMESAVGTSNYCGDLSGENGGDQWW